MRRRQKTGKNPGTKKNLQEKKDPEKKRKKTREKKAKKNRIEKNPEKKSEKNPLH